MSEATEVTMNDGRKVSFPGERRMQKGYAVENGKVTARFDFLNGQTIDFVLPDSLVYQAAGHGVVQKAGDAAAGNRDKMTVEDMYNAVQDTLDNLSKGNWKVEREGGTGFAGSGVVVRALCAVFNKTPEQIKAWVDGKIAEAEKRGPKLTRQALYGSFRSSDKVGPKIRELEAAAAKSAAGVDAEAMLGELS
jgi:hypothetical protein